MSTYDLEEQEQLASLKAWWKEQGGLVLLLITGAAALGAAWNGWNWYQRHQGAKAAAQYEVLLQHAGAHDLKGVREAAGGILEQYPRTSYAAMAALVSAREHYRGGDRKTARAQLEWLVGNSRSSEVRSIARLRLASLVQEEGEFDAAIKILDEKPEASFEALFASTRGDIQLAQGKSQDARASYRTALEAKSLDPGMRQLVQAKMDALGES
mgnify:CR=1 FL=1